MMHQPQRAAHAVRDARATRRAVTDAVPARGSLWRDVPFRRFWLGQTLSQFGDRISELALPLIAVVLLDASANEVGLLTAAVWGPNVVSLFVGSWVDQQPRKRLLLIVADLGRAAVLLTVPLAYVFCRLRASSTASLITQRLHRMHARRLVRRIKRRRKTDEHRRSHDRQRIAKLHLHRQTVQVIDLFRKSDELVS